MINEWQIGDKVIIHHSIYTIESINGVNFKATNTNFGEEFGVVGSYKNLKTDFVHIFNHHSD